MRWLVEDPRSSLNEGTYTIEFSRQILWECYDDEITVPSGGHQDYIYTIAASSTTRASTESHTYSNCALVYTCQIYDATYEIWTTTSDPPIESCNSGGVTYGVDASDASLFQPSLTRQYRAVYTSTYSTMDARVAYDEFSLTVRDTCYASEPSLVAGIDDATYKVDATSVGINYTPNFDPDAGSCPYTLTIRAKLATQPDSDYEATGSGSNYAWIVNSSGYTATVTYTDHRDYPEPVVYIVWWHYVLTSPITSEITGSADDYMELTLVDLCWDNVPSVT